MIQEFANPVTRPILELYPEDGEGPSLKHPRQGKKWAKEVDPNVAAPMARALDGRDYFIHELAMAKLGSQENIAPVVVARWFQRDGAIVSKAYPVHLRHSASSRTPDMVVDTRDTEILEVPLSAYIFCVKDLLDPVVQERWGIPSPERLCCKYDTEPSVLVSRH